MRRSEVGLAAMESHIKAQKIFDDIQTYIAFYESFFIFQRPLYGLVFEKCIFMAFAESFESFSILRSPISRRSSSKKLDVIKSFYGHI